MATEAEHRAVAKWALSGSTGASSEAIAAHLLGTMSRGDYPHDAGDFERCEALLDAVPTFRDRLHEMASVNAYWAALAPRWEEIRAADDGSKYALIQSIVRPIEDKDSRHVRLGDGVSVRFGSL